MLQCALYRCSSARVNGKICHVADYDNRREWSQTEALDIVVKAAEVFETWQTIRTAPEAGTYLLAMLLGKQR